MAKLLLTYKEVEAAVVAASLDIATGILELQGVEAPDNPSPAYNKYYKDYLTPARDNIVKHILGQVINDQEEKLREVGKNLEYDEVIFKVAEA